MVQWIRIHLPIQRIDPWFRKIPRPMEQLSGCHSYQSPCPRGPMLCNKSSHHNENSVHRNDTVASTHCNWRKTCINEDWAQPKIKINRIKKKKKNKRNVVGQVNWSDISTLAIICLYLCLSLQRKAPWGQEPFLICICNYCILLREVRYSHPSVHLPCYCLSLLSPSAKILLPCLVWVHSMTGPYWSEAGVTDHTHLLG